MAIAGLPCALQLVEQTGQALIDIRRHRIDELRRRQRHRLPTVSMTHWTPPVTRHLRRRQMLVVGAHRRCAIDRALDFSRLVPERFRAERVIDRQCIRPVKQTPHRSTLSSTYQAFDVSCDYLLVDDAPADPSTPPKTSSATASPPSPKPTDRDLVLAFIDALVTKTRLKHLAADAS